MIEKQKVDSRIEVFSITPETLQCVHANSN